MATKRKKRPNRYTRILEAVFQDHYKQGDTRVDFKREEIEHFCEKLNIKFPKNLGDVLYSFRYRADLPQAIQATVPEGFTWYIFPAGRSKYTMVLRQMIDLTPQTALAETKVPNATPGIVTMYSMNDEQALLAILRYNRLVDVFMGVTCYSLQNHLRTTVPDMGQVETDEIYVGLDRRGAHYVFPIQAKGGKDRMNIVQIEQDFALCAHKFPDLICRPIGAQFMADNVIALFAFERTSQGAALSMERHYRVVRPEELTDEELKTYRERATED